MKTLYLLISILLTVSLAVGSERPPSPTDSEPIVSVTDDLSEELAFNELQEECTDFSDFRDKLGYTCAAYINSRWCNNRFTNDDGVSPVAACCVCGGGTKNEDNNPPTPFEGKYYIKSLPFDNHLRFWPDGYHTRVDMTENKSLWEEIVIVPVPGKRRYYIKSGYFDDTYLSVDPESDYLTASSSRSINEEFRIFLIENNGGVRIRHANTGKFMLAASGDFAEVTLSEFASTEGTLFVLEDRIEETPSPSAVSSTVPSSHPTICGDSTDDFDTTRTNGDTITVTCEWVSQRNSVPFWCEKPNVSDNCPETCGLCRVPLTAAPTATATATPSTAPSEEPTNDPPHAI